MARETNLPLLVQLRLPDDLGAAIDQWRREQSDIPTRSEAIRRLLKKALAS
jgi:metal-responsive CopG/Arc/MetJ family transcriptional regulator